MCLVCVRLCYCVVIGRRVKELEKHVRVIENLVETIDEENPLRRQRTHRHLPSGEGNATSLLSAESSSNVPLGNRSRLKKQQSERKKSESTTKIPFSSSVSGSDGAFTTGEDEKGVPSL